jgi:hypothetical protein
MTYTIQKILTQFNTEQGYVELANMDDWYGGYVRGGGRINKRTRQVEFLLDNGDKILVAFDFFKAFFKTDDEVCEAFKQIIRDLKKANASSTTNKTFIVQPDGTQVEVVDTDAIYTQFKQVLNSEIVVPKPT